MLYNLRANIKGNLYFKNFVYIYKNYFNIQVQKNYIIIVVSRIAFKILNTFEEMREKQIYFLTTFFISVTIHH
jgi:hypothetical protein